MTLHDVIVVDYRADVLTDDLWRGHGTLRGTVFARVSPKPWSWSRILSFLLLLLLLLALLLWMLSRCGSMQPWIDHARAQAASGWDAARSRVAGGDIVDEDAKLVSEASRGTSDGYASSGASNGSRNMSSGSGRGLGDGHGGSAAGMDAPSGAGSDGGQPRGRRYSVDEAVQKPDLFFAACDTPVHMSGDLLFDLNRDELKPESLPLMNKLVQLLATHPDDQRLLRIVGHSDETGSDAYNAVLSERRAQRVGSWLADALEKAGRSTTVMAVEGRGKREPLVPSGSPAALQRLNRRVEVTIACR